MKSVSKWIHLWLAIAAGPSVAFAEISPEELIGKWGGELVFEAQRAKVFYEISESDGELYATLTMPKGGLSKLGPSKIVKTGGRWVLGWFGNVTDIEESGDLKGKFQHYDKSLPMVLRPIDLVPDIRHDELVIREPEIAWVTEGLGGVWTAPVLSEDLLIVGDDEGSVWAIEKNSGEVKWRRQTKAGIYASPTVAGDIVYMSSDDGYIYAIEVDTGRQLWRTRLSETFIDREKRLPRFDDGTYDYRSSSVIVSGEMLFVGGASGGVAALDKKTGTALWSFATAERVSGNVAVTGDRVVFACRDGYVYSVARKTGEEEWRYDLGAPLVSTPAIAGELVIVGSRNASIVGLQVRDGSLAWERLTWTSWVESSAVVDDGMLFIGSSDVAKLYARTTSSGDIVWEQFLGGSVWSTPSVTDNCIYAGITGTVGYFAPHEGGFACVDRESGALVWRLRFEPIEGEFLYGCPGGGTADGERVYFGSLDGRVLAVEQ